MTFSYEDNSNLLLLEHEDHSVLSAKYAFRDPIDFFVCLQLGDDLWPHSRESSEKPITKDFQFSQLIGRFGTPGSIGKEGV